MTFAGRCLGEFAQTGGREASFRCVAFIRSLRLPESPPVTLITAMVQWVHTLMGH